jgi:FKBP-type peptidyl-prolyl cis-trans isomerase (trigger factor)
VDLEKAKKADLQKVTDNVRTSLILQNIIKSENITCEQEDILAYIKSMAPEYLDPEMFINWYAKDRARIEQAQFMVLENKVFEFLKGKVSSKEKKMTVEKIEALLK